MSTNDIKMLVIMPSLTSGGAERSLINFLSELKEHYSNVDLLLFQQKGLFYNLIPNSINVIATPLEMDLLYGPFKNIFKHIKKNFALSFKILFLRILIKILRNLIPKKTEMAKNQYVWKLYKSILTMTPEKYDVAIAFQQTHPINFLIDKVDSTIKIGWIHSSYKGNKFNEKIDLPFFKKLDSLYTVSEECLDELKSIFSEEDVKVKLMKNIVSPKAIKDMATLKPKVIFNQSKFNIVTVGRLEEPKGYDLMLKSIKILEKAKKVDFCLYIIGEGTLKGSIESFINENKLHDEVKLLGVQENPYSIVNQADLYIQTSYYEGYGLAIEEAKILKKPLLLTNFSCANIHVNHGENGVIVNKNSSDIYNGLLEVYENLDIYKKSSENFLNKEYFQDESFEEFIKSIDASLL